MFSRSRAKISFGILISLICVRVTAVDDPTGVEPPQNSASVNTTAIDQDEEKPYVPKSKAELRRKLTAMQFKVTQNEGTEPAFRNEYWNNKRKGTYLCVVCERPLFNDETKFDSGTGWPSFWKPLNEDSVGYKSDWHLLYERTEVHCKRCDAHLGHVFDDGPQPTGRRYCMNSASLKFVPTKAEKPAAAAGRND